MDSLDPNKLQAAVNYIDTWLDLNFDNSRIPAMQVAIQHGDTPVYSRPFGYADLSTKTKLTKEHVFRIASHSKTFTSTAMLQLVEGGKLNLDDPVSKYIPWFTSSKDNRIRQVTLRQLLNHTAGMIRDGVDADYWQFLRPFPDEHELKVFIAESGLIYDADEQFKYSNFGFGYLGLVIQAVSGMPYYEYVTKNIIEPLSLGSTGPDLDDRAKGKLANGYSTELFGRDRRLFDHIETRALAPATGFYSNAEDVCRYFAAHFLGNEVLLSDHSKRQMQHGYWESSGMERYGLGMVHYKRGGWAIYGHSGGFPGFVTNTQFDAKRKLVVTVLTNADGPAKQVCSSLINMIDTFQQDTPPGESKGIDNGKFEGRFYSLQGATDIVTVGEKLFSLDPLYWTGFEDATELVVLDENTLKIEKTNNYHSPGETIEFTFVNDKVEKISYAGCTIVPYEQAEQRGWLSGRE